MFAAQLEQAFWLLCGHICKDQAGVSEDSQVTAGVVVAFTVSAC